MCIVLSGTVIIFFFSFVVFLLVPVLRILRAILLDLRVGTLLEEEEEEEEEYLTHNKSKGPQQVHNIPQSTNHTTSCTANAQQQIEQVEFEPLFSCQIHLQVFVFYRNAYQPDFDHEITRIRTICAVLFNP